MIVDASVAVLWFVEQKQSAAAVAFLDANSGLMAPNYITLEVAGALLRFVRRGALNEDIYRLVIAEKLSNHVKYWDDLPPLITDAAHLAFRYGGSVSDASYIALAQQLNLPLATADQRQAETARKAAIDVTWIE